MSENGVKVVRLADGDLLRVPPGTDTGDLEVVSEGDEGQPEVVTTEAAPEPEPQPEPEPEPEVVEESDVEDDDDEDDE